MTRVFRAAGRGAATGHHGELVQGQFTTETGQTQRGLLTLPCPMAASRAVYEAVTGEGLSIEPYTCRKALVAAESVLERLDRQDWGGCITLKTNIPEGLGMGSSCADVLAAMRAVVDAFEADLSHLDLAKMAVQAETASDPLMIRDAVLFAHRDGEIIEAFGPQLPPMLIVSVNTDPGAVVDTIDFEPANYTPAMISDFDALRDRLRWGIQNRNLSVVAEAATRSAYINQAFLPKPRFEELHDIARRLGALGVQVAHSGTVAGLIFDVMADIAADPALIAAHLEAEGFAPSATFTVGGY